MDRGSFFRIILVLAIALLAAWLLINISSANDFVGHYLHAIFGFIQEYIKPFFESVIFHVISGISFTVLVFQYHTVLRFIRRSLTRTDELVIGDWYVYRYTKSQGEIKLLTDIWSIHRSFSSNYVVSIFPLERRRRHGKKHNARVTYNERDRLNILLEGFDHKEQSLICFSPRIPVDNDSRTLGLGVGDDADYVLSSRIYLASRDELPREHVVSVLDDASKTLRESGEDQLIQLKTTTISEIFMRHKLERKPIPDDENKNILWSRITNFWKVIFNKAALGRKTD